MTNKKLKVVDPASPEEMESAYKSASDKYEPGEKRVSRLTVAVKPLSSWDCKKGVGKQATRFMHSCRRSEHAPCHLNIFFMFSLMFLKSKLRLLFFTISLVGGLNRSVLGGAGTGLVSR